MAFGVAGSADPPLVTEAWVARFNGTGNGSDEAYAVSLGPDGSVFVAGHSVGSGTERDYATLKYSPAGDLLWARLYNGPGNSTDIAYDVAAGSDGSVVVAGRSVGSGTGDDYAILKYSAAGDLLWERRYDGPGSAADEARAVGVGTDGSVYVTGQSWGGSTSEDFATLKYSAGGTLLWERRYNGPGNVKDLAWGLALGAGNTVHVTGQSWGGSTGYDFATLKYSAGGDLLWERRFNGPANSSDEAYAVTVGADGSVAVAGHSVGSGTERDSETLKYSAAGELLWERRYNGPGNSTDIAYALDMGSDGSVAVAGRSVGSGTGDDYGILKYSTAGDLLWDRRYDGPGSAADEARAVAVGTDGSVYVTGQSWGGSTSEDYATLKYSPEGDLIWEQRYNGPGNVTDLAWGLALGANDTVYVTGQSWGGSSGYDFATIQYTQPVRNTAPVVDGDKTITVLEDAAPTPLNIAAPTDAQGDSLTITVDVVPSTGKGVVRRSGGGAVVAAETLSSSELTGLEFAVVADAHGSAGTFRYTVTDGNGGSASQTVTLAITPVNDPPAARGDGYSGWRSCPVRIAAPGVLGNDTDTEGSPLGAALDQLPGGGIVVLNADGSFAYTPQPGTTSDSFTYRAFDGADYSTPATVTLTLQADSTPPTCVFGGPVSQSAPPLVYVPITVADTQSGVASVQLTPNSRNCKLVDPTTGMEVPIGGTLTYDPSLASRGLRVVKLAPSLAARVELRIVDCSGNSLLTDPVLDNLKVPKRQVKRVFRNLPAAEHYLRLENGTPGLTELKLWVNGRRAHAGLLTDGEILRLDLAPWMRAGSRNVVRLVASGPTGATASLLIGDAALAGGAPRAVRSGHGVRAALGPAH
jgi:uncharacterized delta-60 repeat protein